MRNEFAKQLETLNIEIIKMGALCEKMIDETTNALFQGDTDHISAIHDEEEIVDKRQREIEGICMNILLKQQPVASDLRVVSSALGMITDMERIGDQCADISDMIRFTLGKDMNGYPALKQMSKETKIMVNKAIESFVKKDFELAKDVIARDNLVDELFVKVKENLIKFISKNPEEGEFWIDIIMIAKYFERIGDHATNVAEWVAYSITGEKK